MRRRDFLALAACLPAFGGDGVPADITLRIAEITAELGPKHTVRTVAYNGQTPGPLLRMTEGKSVTVEVVNDTDRPELVHWHGLHIPPEVDGAHEEGTPLVQGRDRRRYTFTPQPSGTCWYHTHAMAHHNLTIGSYSGQFGMLIVEPRTDPIRLTPNARNRLVFENRGMMDHPVHTHRYNFELARYAGRATSGVWKDVVTVPMHQTVEVDLTANHLGPALFHCHNQFHMDFGFMAVMYA